MRAGALDSHEVVDAAARAPDVSHREQNGGLSGAAAVTAVAQHQRSVHENLPHHV